MTPPEHIPEGVSPLPWEIRPNGAAWNLHAAGDEEHAAVFLGMAWQEESAHDANAAFIVQAVNAYPKLVAGLTAALRVMDHPLTYVDRGLMSGLQLEQITAARSVLAECRQAKGGPSDAE